MDLDKPRPVVRVGARATTDEWYRLILEGVHEGGCSVSTIQVGRAPALGRPQSGGGHGAGACLESAQHPSVTGSQDPFNR